MKPEEVEKARRERVTAIFKQMEDAVKEFKKASWDDFKEVEVVTPVRNALSVFIKKATKRPKKSKEAKK